MHRDPSLARVLSRQPCLMPCNQSPRLYTTGDLAIGGVFRTKLCVLIFKEVLGNDNII